MSMLKTLSMAGLATAIAVTAPTAVQAATFSYSTQLNGANEVPANDSTATGLATGALTGDESNWEFTYDVGFSGLAAELILAHIHLANSPEGADPTQQVGPVVHDLNNAPVNAGVTSGMFSGRWTSADVVATGAVAPEVVFRNFLAGRYYFNLHSAGEFATPGEIRGQIEFDDDSVAVPEPATGLALMVAAALGLMAARQKKDGLTES